METFIIIEADTEMHSLFAYKVERNPDGNGDNYIYTRVMGCEADVHDIPPEVFFGKVNALLPAKEKLNHAPKLELVTTEVQP